MKKIWTLAITFVSLFFISSLETQAATTTFSYTNLYSNFYALTSACIDVENEASVLIKIPVNDYTVYENGNVDSYVSFYDDNACSGGNLIDNITFFSQAKSDYIYNGYYDFEFNTLFPDDNIRSIKILLMTNLSTPVAPSGLTSYMSQNTEIEFGDLNTVIYKDGLTTFYTTQYISIVDLIDGPEREDHTFLYWKDINGDPFINGLPNESQIQDGILYLYSSFAKNVDLDIAAGIPPEVDGPIDVILFNTGFFNTPGFILLYLILIVSLNVGLWYLGIGNNYASLIGNISITAIFMFLGYLPIYVSAIMIMLYMYMVFGMNGSVTYE